MGREEDRVRKIMAEMAKGQDYGHKLKFDPVSKTIGPVPKNQSNFNLYSLPKDPDGPLKLAPSDANLYKTCRGDW